MTFDPKDPVLYRDEFGYAFLRYTLTAVFFVRKPISEASELFQKVFERWLHFVPDDVLQWCLVGNAEYDKPFNKSGKSRCLSQINTEKAIKRDWGYFTICGPESTAGEWSSMFSLESEVHPQGPKCHVIEMCFPLSYSQAPQIKVFIEYFKEINTLLDSDSAYASLRLFYPNKMDIKGARPMIAPLAMRHPGLDIVSSDATAWKIGGLCRGAHWLNYIGSEQIKKLGGLEIMRKQLPKEMELALLGNGVFLQAGEVPQTGDLAEKDNLPLYRTLARFLEPITLFGDIISTLGAHKGAWERRFLD